MNPSDNYVYVPVPVPLLAQVLELIAMAMRGQLQADHVPPGEDGIVEGSTWTASLFERAVRESVGAMLAIWDLLTSRPDEWIPQADVREATGLTDRQLAGVWGQFTKRCMRYGRSRDDWPFQSTSQADQYFIRIGTEAAALVRHVRADMPA